MAAGEAVSAVNVGDRVRVTCANTAALSRGEVVRVTWVCPLGSGHINVVRDGENWLSAVRLLPGEFEKVQP